jgi:hypothetical protein
VSCAPDVGLFVVGLGQLKSDIFFFYLCFGCDVMVRLGQVIEGRGVWKGKMGDGGRCEGSCCVL